MRPAAEAANTASAAPAAPADAGGRGLRSLLRSPAGWVLVLVFGLEFFLFDQFGSKRHTGVYPRWNDQIQYLSEGYTAYERARTGGFGAALEHTLVNPSAQGTLHDVASLIVFSLAGPSRSAALALNLFALMAWQAALFVGIAHVGKSRALAFAAALLPLALAGPWENIPGSAYDFRLDHFAMCGLGVVSSLALLTDGFRARRAALVFGTAVGLTLLTRFLTGTYFAVLFVGLLAWTLTGVDRRVRVANLGRAAFVAFLIAAPFFWLNRQHVFEYYWIGHYVGPESAIRDPHMGLGASVRYVFGHLGQRHLGMFFGALALIGAVGYAWGRRGGESTPALRSMWLVGALFVMAPVLVLTLHRQKSEVVLGVIAPGVVLLVAAVWLALSRRSDPRTHLMASVVLSCAALVFFAQRQLRPAYDPATLAHIRQVNTIADRIFARTQQAQLPRPWVGVDYITDCLDAQVLRVICYERKRVWVPFDMTLPTSIAEPNEPDVMERLARSDFFFLTDESPPGNFPYDHKLAAMRPQLRAWCEANLRAAERFELFGRRMTLYQRPEIPLK